MRRNPLIGIRTTWTLTSDENWLRTHRCGAWAFTVSGVLGGLLGFLGAPAVGLVVMLSACVVPAVYSYVLARRSPSTHSLRTPPSA